MRSGDTSPTTPHSAALHPEGQIELFYALQTQI